jgi:hypothetical protein
MTAVTPLKNLVMTETIRELAGEIVKTAGDLEFERAALE